MGEMSMAAPLSRLFIGALTLLFICMFVPITFAEFGTHDWQRVFQTVIAFFLLFFLWSRRANLVFPGALGHLPNLAICALSLLAILSVCSSHQPGWALTELSLMVACVEVGMAIAIERHGSGEKTDKILLALIFGLCSAKAIQFSSGLAAALLSGFPTLDVDVLLDGFSNKRFYGQFQTFTLPLLALPLLLFSLSSRLRVAAFGLLSFWWMISISGGTRGTWLGMGVAGLVMIFCGPYGRRWLSWQAVAVLTGCLFYWCLIIALPALLNITTLQFAGDRLTMNLSAREVIWRQAWEMILAHPVLGYGPMHFADIPNPIAAHPHQMILQWACEWGVPSAVLVGGAILRGLFSTIRLIRKKGASCEPVDVLRLCLLASLLGALTQAMVDGVIVMPYSQLWLSIIVGWLFAIHEWETVPVPLGATAARCSLALMAVAVLVLGYVIARDLPHLQERQQRYAHDFGEHFQPRFWMQGVIATKPN